MHEGRFRLSEMAGKDTKHPHRGFDNLWYVLQGSASTGHTTGPGGAVERARLSEGSLLALRTGRGAWHAEAVGADEVEEGHGDTEFRSVLFWVNLARKDKDVEPSAQVLQPEEIPSRQEGDAIVRVLVGEGSPVQLGTPALILDVELPEGGGSPPRSRRSSRGSPTCWRARQLRGEPAPGEASPTRRCWVRERAFTVTDAAPGTRFMLMAGQAVRGDADVQRAVRGLIMTPGSRGSEGGRERAVADGQLLESDAVGQRIEQPHAAAEQIRREVDRISSHRPAASACLPGEAPPSLMSLPPATARAWSIALAMPSVTNVRFDGPRG